jgi:hypothetical protein
MPMLATAGCDEDPPCLGEQFEDRGLHAEPVRDRLHVADVVAGGHGDRVDTATQVRMARRCPRVAGRPSTVTALDAIPAPPSGRPPAQPDAAGDQHGAAGISRDKRPHLCRIGGVVQHDEDPPAAQPLPVQGRRPIEVTGNGCGLDAERAQEVAGTSTGRSGSASAPRRFT